jgi:hypothetical protein
LKNTFINLTRKDFGFRKVGETYFISGVGFLVAGHDVGKSDCGNYI